ncbi:MAG: DUF885 domain-containing protein [Proteobacteria bacterium]|nr:MAG: DUF885 domain-containing protein [Pseudomonadota bacterium]
MHPLNVRLLVAIVALILCTTAGAAETEQAVARLHRLFAEAWEQDLADDPRGASYLGDKRYNDRWADHSLAAWARRNERYGAWLAQLERIPRDALPPDERLNYDLFQRLYADRLMQYRFGAHLRAIDQLNYSAGVLTANEVAEVIDFADARDYEQWIARLRGMDQYVDQTIELLRQGIATGNTQPRIIVERVTRQLQAQLVDDPTASPFFAPFTKMPAALDAAQRARLTREAEEAIRRVVVPAFKRLDAFLTQAYLPAARDTVGIWDTPDGEDFYRSRVRWFTTTPLSPEEIHSLGLQEVERIRAQMLEIIERVGFEGDFDAFLTHLRTDPKFRYTSGEELLNAYMVMAKRIDPMLPNWFGKLPRIPYGVRPIPAANAPDTTTAYYQPPSDDGRRPGYYYVNLYRPEERPTYEIPVLTVHEAVPGHHLQLALARELGELPPFRRYFEATAYVEGWALYAESLGEEMGLYTDPYDKFGQLTYEMWRAVRLVVDTGIHHKRWTREQAIAFFKANAAKSELDIVNEIDRYIAWPGQALAYKIGELKIKELRRRAQARLGERFDLRAFHDVVLGTGAVPLDVLERRVDEWIASQAHAG